MLGIIKEVLYMNKKNMMKLQNGTMKQLDLILNMNKRGIKKEIF